MEPFSSSCGDLYILLVMDYISKWVEAIATSKNDPKIVLKFLHKNIFTWFRVPGDIINDDGIHFDNKLINKALRRYGFRHKIAMTYIPHTNSQAEISNREIKLILEKMVNPRRKDWSPKLDEALWAYRSTFKTPLGNHPSSITRAQLPILLGLVNLKSKAANTEESEEDKPCDVEARLIALDESIQQIMTHLNALMGDIKNFFGYAKHRDIVVESIFQDMIIYMEQNFLGFPDEILPTFDNIEETSEPDDANPADNEHVPYLTAHPPSHIVPDEPSHATQSR
ncbi:uncharacterized protein LOC120208139 [Hibiscus syriacus]|uniref:uncharacterized protein LOC120208139 n=1 Tax=Hibiscus syriacus TaxID=106335 RepID=UPI001921B7E7|nr:uncharacterized protein LOC120208139 [Hibiscus syriacus]